MTIYPWVMITKKIINMSYRILNLKDPILLHLMMMVRGALLAIILTYVNYKFVEFKFTRMLGIYNNSLTIKNLLLTCLVTRESINLLVEERILIFYEYG